LLTPGLKHQNVYIFLILSAWTFSFRVYILYIELIGYRLYLTQYQLNVQLSSIYFKYFSLNQQVLQATSMDVSVQNATPIYHVD